MGPAVPLEAVPRQRASVLGKEGDAHSVLPRKLRLARKAFPARKGQDGIDRCLFDMFRLVGWIALGGFYGAYANANL